jgi:hypothetical protein
MSRPHGHRGGTLDPIEICAIHWKGIAMKLNLHLVDRALRIIAGLALVALAVTGTIGLWGYIGVVLVLTGAVGFCPIYRLLGISTCPTRSS